MGFFPAQNHGRGFFGSLGFFIFRKKPMKFGFFGRVLGLKENC